jgi:DNA-binding MarR family transcriptional regulator
MAFDRRLFFVLHRAHRVLLASANAATIEHLGVSSAQLTALQYVAKHDGCSMTMLADVLDLNKSGVSGLVDRMEHAELLHREPNPRDGRGSLLRITPKGQQVRERALPLLRRLNAELTSGFTAEEEETVLRFLNAIIERYADNNEGGDP